MFNYEIVLWIYELLHIANVNLLRIFGKNFYFSHENTANIASLNIYDCAPKNIFK